MIVETMLTHAEYTPPLKVVNFDYCMDRLPEWWVLDAKGKKIARFFDKYLAKDFLIEYDRTYQNSKIQAAQDSACTST